MKLRILDNSIRLRLSRTDVAELRDRGLLRCRVDFPGGNAFCYSLESTPANVAPTARFEDGELLVRVPETSVREWADSERVSIEGQEGIDSATTLSILVEKDFACLSPREGEDESDMFEHPDAGKRTC